MKHSITVCLAAWLTAMAVAGCSEHHHHHGHDVDEPSATIAVTAYDAAYEVYAEMTPPVAGATGDVLVHVTELESFHPLEATAGLDVRLDAGGSTAMAVPVAEPSTQPGLFRLTLTPAAEGIGTLTFDVRTPRGTTRLAVPGARVYADRHEAQHAAAEAAEATHDAVFFSKESAWRVPFRTEPCHTGPFGGVIRTMAQVLPAPADECVLTARTAGIVRMEVAAPSEGMSVEAGQVLLHIASSDLADGNLAVRLREAESAYRLAQQDYERKQALAADRIVAAADVQQARARLEAAEAAYDALRRGFAGGRQAVASPMAGTVTQVMVRNGQYVEAGQAVATVAQHAALRLRAEVPARRYRELARIATAHVRLLDGGETYTLEALGGRLVSYARAGQAGSPLLPVLLEVTRTDVLPPAGTFVELFLKTEDRNPVVSVPVGAIVEEMGSCFVFVQLTPERFEKRPVRLGRTDGLRTEITSGLTGDERIVTEGAVLVKLAQAAGALDVHSGHSH